MSVTITPSILSADFTRLGEEIGRIGNADWVHVDIMDGHFVPNLSFGPAIVEAARGVTDKPFDVHLMIEEPETWVERYAKAGADTIIFHVEAAADPHALVARIRELGARAAFSVKPKTPIEDYLDLAREADQVLVMSVEPGFGGQAFMPEQLSKVEMLDRLRRAEGLDLTIEIDGGISADTIGQAAAAGVDSFVAGSAVYGAPDPNAAIDELRRLAEAARAR